MKNIIFQDNLELRPLLANEQATRKESLTRSVDRIAIYDVNDIMSLLVGNANKQNSDPTKKALVKISDLQVSVSSLKLRTFFNFANDLECSNKDCCIKPAYFALERMKEKNGKKPSNKAYLSLYGVDKNGVEVEFTHDHTLARCFGGANSLVNTTPMCIDCNHKKSQVESQTHNQTLSILKKHIKQLTGQNADLKYALQRVKSFEATPVIDMIYDKIGSISLQAGIEAIRQANDEHNLQGERTCADFLGVRLNLKGSRLKSFAKDDQPCCDDQDCKIQATHFDIERLVSVGGKKLKDHILNYQLNMYGKNKYGKTISFSHHHSVEADNLGVPYIKDTVTLCEDCKTRHNKQNHQYLAKSLIQYGGVHKEDTPYSNSSHKDVNANNLKFKIDQRKTKKEKQQSQIYDQRRRRVNIREMAAKLASKLEMNHNQFIRYCQASADKQPKSEGYKNGDITTSKARIMKEFGLSEEGAVFFRSLCDRHREDERLERKNKLA